jgi:hypothetical protein
MATEYGTRRPARNGGANGAHLPGSVRRREGYGISRSR